jgi:hypothetical protein
MNKEQILKVFNEVVDWALNQVKGTAPVKTGELRDSFKIVFYDDGWGIQTTVSYMEYTEMEWTYNSRWGKTLKNPNQYWFRNVAIIITEELARRLGGVIYVK